MPLGTAWAPSLHADQGNAYIHSVSAGAFHCHHCPVPATFSAFPEWLAWLVKGTVNGSHAALVAQGSASPHRAASVNPAEFLGFAWSSDSPLYSNALFMHSLASM